jgi:hypothetical protein
MNRHCYGSPKGLSLKTLSKEVGAAGGMAGQIWHTISSARISNDELIIRVAHAKIVTSATGRDAVDGDRYYVCPHLTVDHIGHWNAMSHRIPEIGVPDKIGSSEPFQECWDSLGCCSACLTDYKVTIERCAVLEADAGSDTEVYTSISLLSECG